MPSIVQHRRRTIPSPTRVTRSGHSGILAPRTSFRSAPSLRLQHQQRQIVLRRPSPNSCTSRRIRSAISWASSPAQPESAAARPSPSSNWRGPLRRSVTPSVTHSRLSPGRSSKRLARRTRCPRRPRAGSAARPRPYVAVRAQEQRQRVPGGGEGAADAALEGDEFAVEEGEEAGLRALGVDEAGVAGRDQGAGGGVRRLGGVVEEELVEAVEDVGDAVALAGEQPQPGPGEADDHGRLGALALDVADGEAPAAVAGREQVVEVAAGPALVARLVHERAAHAGDLGDRAGQQSALQDAADGGLAGVLAGRADGERDRRLRSSTSPVTSSGKRSSPARPMTSVPSGRPPAISR